MNEQSALLSINRVIIAGTLLHDPPLRRTKKGIAVTNFLLTTTPETIQKNDEGTDRESTVVSIVAWAKQAEQITKHLRKGSPILVMGELQSMPNYDERKNFYPVQISSQWVQYLEKGSVVNIEDDMMLEEFISGDDSQTPDEKKE